MGMLTKRHFRYWGSIHGKTEYFTLGTLAAKANHQAAWAMQRENTEIQHCKRKTSQSMGKICNTDGHSQECADSLKLA